MLQHIASKVRSALGLLTQAEVDGQIEAARITALEEGRRAESDRLATELLQRGGFATIQLNAHPFGLPRMKFIHPSEATPVNAVRLDDGMIIVRKHVEQEGQ